jgi:hypothetical protein
MKKKFIYLYFLILFNSINSISQITKISNSFVPISHPRLLLLKGEENEILKEIKTDKLKRKVHNAIIQKSDEMLDLPTIKRTLIGFRLLDKSREFLKRIFYLSYAYRTTHKLVYAERAQLEMLTVASFSDWNPRHFLDVGEMATGMAIGYDWLYDYLKPEYRNIIANSIITYGLEPSLDSKNNGWLAYETNWNQVCNTGMLFGAAAVYEKQPVLALNIINRSISSIHLPMKQYAPDGGYPEGYGYWDYGTCFNVLFIASIEKIFQTDFGLSQSPGFLKTGNYYLNMVGPFGYCFNYSDCFTNNPEKTISPAMFWLANKNNDVRSIFNQLNVIKQFGLGLMDDDRLLPATLIWSLKMPFENAPKPLSNSWFGTGKTPVALMRSDWQDTDAIFVGFKGGSPSVSHSHLDIGSFVFDALGERWSMDFPMQNYNDLETKGINLWDLSQNSQRWKIFRYNNLAHSTLSFNGEYQRVNGYAPFTKTTSDSNFLSAISNLSSVYTGQVDSVSRGIAIVNKSYVIVKDEIVTCNNDVTVRWTMVTPANVQILENGNAILSQNGKKLELKVVEPLGAIIKTWSTKSTKDYEAQNNGTSLVGFEVKLPKHTKNSLTVLMLPRNKKAISIEKISPLENWAGGN